MYPDWTVVCFTGMYAVWWKPCPAPGSACLYMRGLKYVRVYICQGFIFARLYLCEALYLTMFCLFFVEMYAVSSWPCPVPGSACLYSRGSPYSRTVLSWPRHSTSWQPDPSNSISVPARGTRGTERYVNSPWTDYDGDEYLNQKTFAFTQLSRQLTYVNGSSDKLSKKYILCFDTKNCWEFVL